MNDPADSSIEPSDTVDVPAVDSSSSEPSVPATDTASVQLADEAPVVVESTETASEVPSEVAVATAEPGVAEAVDAPSDTPLAAAALDVEPATEIAALAVDDAPSAPVEVALAAPEESGEIAVIGEPTPEVPAESAATVPQEVPELDQLAAAPAQDVAALEHASEIESPSEPPPAESAPTTSIEV